MIKAYVSDRYQFGADRLAVVFAQRDPDAVRPSCVAKVVPSEFDGAVLEYEPNEPSLAVTAPTMSLTEPEARALLEALSAYFGGTGQAKAARDDYLRECGRVDKLTDALIGVAGRAAVPL